MADVTRSSCTILLFSLFFLSKTLCAVRGLESGVKRELWQAIPGEHVYNLTSSDKYQNQPANIDDVLTALDSPIDIGDNYGQKLTTYFLAPETGRYYFYLSCNLACQLWISTDDTSNNVELNTQVTPPGLDRYLKDWHKSETPIVLNEKNFYLIQVLMKEQNGTDFLSVGVDCPNGSSFKPIRALHFLYLDLPEQRKGSYNRASNNVIPDVNNKIHSTAATSQLSCANYCITEVTCQSFSYHVTKHVCILYSSTYWRLGESDNNIQYYTKTM